QVKELREGDAFFFVSLSELRLVSLADLQRVQKLLQQLFLSRHGRSPLILDLKTVPCRRAIRVAKQKAASGAASHRLTGPYPIAPHHFGKGGFLGGFAIRTLRKTQ